MQMKHKNPNKMTNESNVLSERTQLSKGSSEGTVGESSNIFEWLKNEIDDSSLSRKELEEIGDNLSKNNPDINEIIEMGKHLKNYNHDSTTNTVSTVKLHIVPASKNAMTSNRKPARPHKNSKKDFEYMKLCKK